MGRRAGHRYEDRSGAAGIATRQADPPGARTVELSGELDVCDLEPLLEALNHAANLGSTVSASLRPRCSRQRAYSSVPFGRLRCGR